MSSIRHRDGRVPPLAPQVVQRQVVGDREQPGRELRPGPIPLARPVDPQEDLLRQVLRLLDPADQVDQDAEQPVLIALDQDLEGPRDVVADLEHQPDVGVAASSCCSRASVDTSHSLPRSTSAETHQATIIDQLRY